MAWEQNPYALKLTCSPDVSTLGGQQTNTNASAPMTQFSFVYLTGASNPGSNQNAPLVGVVSAVSTRPLGVVQNAPRARYNALGVIEGVDEAEVTLSGITKVIAGGVITIGTPITVDASGRAVPALFGTISAAGQVTSATVSAGAPTYTVSNGASANPYAVGEVVAVSGITGTGGTLLNFTSGITAVGGSSGSWTFTLGSVTTAVVGTATYTSGIVSGSSSYVVGTALSSSAAAGDYITAAIACHNAGRAA